APGTVGTRDGWGQPLRPQGGGPALGECLLGRDPATGRVSPPAQRKRTSRPYAGPSIRRERVLSAAVRDRVGVRGARRPPLAGRVPLQRQQRPRPRGVVRPTRACT